MFNLNLDFSAMTLESLVPAWIIIVNVKRIFAFFYFLTKEMFNTEYHMATVGILWGIYPLFFSMMSCLYLCHRRTDIAHMFQWMKVSILFLEEKGIKPFSFRIISVYILVSCFHILGFTVVLIQNVNFSYLFILENAIAGVTLSISQLGLCAFLKITEEIYRWKAIDIRTHFEEGRKVPQPYKSAARLVKIVPDSSQKKTTQFGNPETRTDDEMLNELETSFVLLHDKLGFIRDCYSFPLLMENIVQMSNATLGFFFLMENIFYQQDINMCIVPSMAMAAWSMGQLLILHTSADNLHCAVNSPTLLKITMKQ